MYWSKVCVREFWYGIWPWYSTWAIQECQWQSCKKRQFQVARNKEQSTNFFSKLIFKAVFKASHNEPGDFGLIPGGCWNYLQPLQVGHFAWNWACQCTDTRSLYCISLSLFFFLGFRSHADRVLTLNIEISDFHCFGALGVRPWSLTLPHVQAWRMGVIIAIVEPQSKYHKRCLAWLAIVFPWNLDFFWKNGQLWGFFKPHPPDCKM